MRFGVSVCFLLLVFPLPVALAHVTVSSDFPGGSGETRTVDSATQTIHLHPTLHRDRGWPCWWYVRVDGLTAREHVTLRVSANPGEFSKGARLSRSWVQPEHAAISVDNVTWTQTPKCKELAEGVVEYKFDAPADTIWLAWGPPFLPTHADALLTRIEKRVPSSKRFVLAKTKQGRDVHAIQIIASTTDRKRPAIWIQARQHAWEAGSSWVGKGFIQWVASDSESAVSLRKTTDIYYVPIMDVDNVSAGAGGKNAIPRDHNRDWSATPHYPEVAAAQKRILEIDDQQSFELFVDLHNPGRNDRSPYFYGPIDLKELTAERQQRYHSWLSACSTAITQPMKLHPTYRFATYVKTREERARVSRGWVQNHTNAITLTLETPWNTTHSTTDGYQQVGAQLGQAIAKYLSRNE